MKTNIHFRSYLTQFFLEWEMFQTKVGEKIKTHFMFNNFFFLILSFMIHVEKYCGAVQATNWQHGARALHTEYLRLQTHAHKK
jgi:hypothetical protein